MRIKLVKDEMFDTFKLLKLENVIEKKVSIITKIEKNESSYIYK